MQRIFGGPILPTLIKLAAASIVVGLLLAFFGIRPIDLWYDFIDTVVRIWHMGFDAIDWSVKYFLLGAVVVVPIWLIVRLWTFLVEKK
ncbi:DUF6460 domain-containing protein [Parvibaculum sp.]|jgi:hypothetical protein|uniref:DUF6460 domain-containing protein n=1 Tax=Parvibaculum sp. TaxID=2024848 RepID=UPI002B6808B6|nr:DUF6460 domain-containing protein [Parvibaculum sp.]HUD53348.1 DUF6460 domain-containing protein [Parvibaculum sp.]